MSWDVSAFPGSDATAPWLVVDDAPVLEMLTTVKTHVEKIQRIKAGECDARVSKLWEDYSRVSKVYAALCTCQLEGTVSSSVKVRCCHGAAFSASLSRPRTCVACSKRLAAGWLQDGSTYKLVENALADDAHASVLLWDAEGQSDGKPPVKQIVQQLKAAQYLASASMPLKTATILTAHSILFEDATEPTDDGGVRLCPGGTVRTESVCVLYGGQTHQYPQLSPNELTARLHAICAAFNDRVARGVHAIEAAIRLAQSVVELHPFRNGNGRLCRLLFAAALEWQGLPLRVVLSSGHAKSRQHYVQALVHAQNATRSEWSRFQWLRVLAVVSVYHAVANFGSQLSVLESRY